MCQQSHFIRAHIDWLPQFNHYCSPLIHKEEHLRRGCLQRERICLSRSLELLLRCFFQGGWGGGGGGRSVCLFSSNINTAHAKDQYKAEHKKIVPREKLQPAFWTHRFSILSDTAETIEGDNRAQIHFVDSNNHNESTRQK